jgi:L-amino acid N-acyltransferase YncA
MYVCLVWTREWDLNPRSYSFLSTIGGGKKGLRARLSTVATGSVCLFVSLDTCQITHFTLIGQTKPVHVYQLIAENTVESKVGYGGQGFRRALTVSP